MSEYGGQFRVIDKPLTEMLIKKLAEKYPSYKRIYAVHCVDIAHRNYNQGPSLKFLSKKLDENLWLIGKWAKDADSLVLGGLRFFNYDNLINAEQEEQKE